VPVQISSQTRERGLLEVTIDEQGRVIQAKLRLSLHPIYDAQLLSAARDWRYQPAMYQGKPVKFRKIIQITVTK
jgi:TonB family protein